MKKLTIVIGIAALMISCGEDHQAKVCECKKLYNEIGEKAAQLEESGEGGITSQMKAIEAYKDKHDECHKFHTEVVGDAQFYEMGKNCK